MCKQNTINIRVSFDTYEDLENVGTLADSFDSLIRELLTSHKKKRGPLLKNESANLQSCNKRITKYRRVDFCNYQ